MKYNFNVQIVQNVLNIRNYHFFVVVLLFSCHDNSGQTIIFSLFFSSLIIICVSLYLLMFSVQVQQRLMLLAMHSCERAWSHCCRMSAAQFGGLSGNLLDVARKSDL